MAKENMKITERDRRAILLVAKLDDKELFGLECYLAGVRAGEIQNQSRQETGKRSTEAVTA